MLSSYASAIKPQVFTTAICPFGLSLSWVTWYPCALKRPISISESTRFFEHPREMKSMVFKISSLE